MNISYQFVFNDHSSDRIDLEIDDTRYDIRINYEQETPDWAKLEFRQCEHCPLEPTQHLYCPVARNLSQVMAKFDHVTSFEEVDLRVELPERIVENHVSVQQAISSLMGLIFATSGCPHTDFMKPMARFHLPLSTEEDTIFRAAGMYLIAQYYRKESGMGHDLEFEGLKNIYANLHKVNTGIADRIRSATRSDSSTNAVVLLDMLTHLMPFAIENKLDELRQYFHAYIS